VTLIGLACALVIGVTLGMLGGGGSILTVPTFAMVLGYDPKLAIAMSLPVVGATSFVGAMGHWRQGNVELRSALPFGAAAMLGAFAGARGSAFLSGRVQLLILGTVMIASALSMLRSARAPAAGAPAADRVAPLPLRLAVGAMVGALTGVVGIGGGFLFVPALVVLARVPMRQAVGTSLAVITMNAAAGFAGQPSFAGIPWAFVILFTGVAMTGILLGTWLGRLIDQRTLKRAFAVFLLFVAALVLWQNQGRL
jgi:uncharacterized membrane protein YfcA